ncbi:MAG: molecular chaperone DnaK [Algisphaera sp.]
MGKILGIDLGTTNSVVAVYDNGKARVIAASSQSNTMPSVVSFGAKGEQSVGEEAVGQQVTNPQNTVYSIKRFMGRRLSEVASEERLIPYKLIGKAEDYVRVSVAGRKFTPPQISAILLTELRRIAEEELGEVCDRAVITVPAYFNDAQRQATADAGAIAGLTVERIINEPTAAALAYGVEHRGSRNIAVVDLGGGTFDLSLMRLGDGKFEVLAVHGNTHLGGDDFDQRIIDIVADDFLRNHQIDVREDPMALQRLKQAAKTAKAELSFRDQVDISVPYIAIASDGPLHLQYTLDRDRFEAVCDDLFGEIHEACRRVLYDASLPGEAIDEVVMVGGSTRMPRVQQVAMEAFKSESVNKSTNPDEVVSLGAAILGGILQGELINVHLMDVTSHGFGVTDARLRMETLIPKNTPIPVTVKKIFSTPTDNQRSVSINVLEGEKTKSQDNRDLGVFRLSGIPKALAGVPRIEVSFNIDANGILNVSARDEASGREQKVTITGAGGMDEEEEKAMRQIAQEAAEKRAAAEVEVSLRNHAERALHTMQGWLQYHSEMIGPKAAQKMESMLFKLQKAIAANKASQMKTCLKKLDEMAEIYRNAA